MRYTVTADVQSPPELFQLDPLQREGVMSLLTGALARAEGMEGPAGCRYWSRTSSCRSAREGRC
ncbi:hypothetical protein ACFQXA_25415 [Nocardiopsis composta]